MRSLVLVSALGGIIILGAGAYFLSHRNDLTATSSVAPAPYSTPPGVTFQTARTGGTVVLATAGMNIPATAAAYADARGMAVYTSDNDTAPGKSSCNSECAQLWPAVKAPADAGSFGDWSVVTRDDGSKQWALHGKPLYTYSKDEKPGDGSGNGVDSAWHLALVDPSNGTKLPSGVFVQDQANASAYVLADQQGMPLYVFDGDKVGGKPTCTAQPCLNNWSPYLAAQIAKPMGDFTIVDRGDGVFQWSYQGRPLYTFNNDVEAGDAAGNGLDGKWHVATVRRHFMPETVQIAHNHFGGDNFVDRSGMTLYVRDRIVGTNTGHNLRSGSRGNPIIGRILGTASCDSECTKTWKPLIAPADAQAEGYWDIVSRDDGSRQWAYRGYAVYSYTKDEKPGDMRGVDELEIMSSPDPFRIADIAVKGMGGLYWHPVAP